MASPKLLRRIKNVFRPEPTISQEEAPPPDILRPLESGQKSIPNVTTFGYYTSQRPSGMVPRRRVLFDINAADLKRHDTDFLLRNLNFISPDASMALWCHMRLAGIPESIEVTDMKGEKYQAGYDYLLEVQKKIGQGAGGFECLCQQLVKTAYILGADCGEVVLDDNLRDTLDIIAIDPSSIEFFPFKRPNGQISYIPKQMQGKGWVELTKPGFFYQPLDPDIGEPHGVSPIITILQVIFFDLQILADLEKISHNQGWERIHYKVVEEILKKNASPAILNSPKKLAEYIDSTLSVLETKLNRIKPDDNLVTSDSITTASIGGSGSSGVAARTLEEILYRKIANSLKILSVFLNYNEGVTETYGTVQWRIQVMTVDSIRAVVASFLERAFTFALNVGGMQGYVKVKYPKLPLEDVVTQANADFMKLRSDVYARDAGILGPDEIAKRLYDKDKAFGPPVSMSGAGAMPSNPNPGAPAEGGLGMTDAIGRPIFPESSERGFSMAQRGGHRSLNIPRAISMEGAYRQELSREYHRMKESMDRVLTHLKLKE